MAAPIKTKPILKIGDTDNDVIKNVCQLTISTAREAIADRGIFTFGISGGSLAKFLCEGLPQHDSDWSKWRVFFCDERHVPFNDSECTYRYYKEHLMSKVPLTDEQVFPDNSDIPVEQAAEEYTEKMKQVFGDVDIPRFDLLLLGMGPDGHTCSLFPGHVLLEEKSKWVASIADSPKPPPQRITMTYPVVNNARNVGFVSCGAGKADMIQRVLEGNEEVPLPAARVNPQHGTLYWFVDKPAAAKLSSAQL